MNAGLGLHLFGDFLQKRLHILRCGFTQIHGKARVLFGNAGVSQPEALQAIAQKALDRQIGARGLRAIMEKIMTKIMFLIPSDLSIQKVIITPEAVEGADPGIVRDTAHPREKISGRK